MSLTSLLKQLKKRLKLRKRWLSLGVVLLLAGSAVLLARLVSPQGQADFGEAVKAWSRMIDGGAADTAEQEKLLSDIVKNGAPRSVELLKTYVCGEETTVIGALPPPDIVQYKKDHPHAVLKEMGDGRLVFAETIDDLSPKCKENAYFGLDKAGNLSLFDDLPEKEQVLRTFFQLNIDRMRSSLPPDMMGELYKGIHVHDLAEFNSVLSTFSEFAVEEQE